MNKHFRRSDLINNLVQICKMGNFEVPDFENMGNKELITMSDKYQIQATISLINNREKLIRE